MITNVFYIEDDPDIITTYQMPRCIEKGTGLPTHYYEEAEALFLEILKDDADKDEVRKKMTVLHVESFSNFSPQVIEQLVPYIDVNKIANNAYISDNYFSPYAMLGCVLLETIATAGLALPENERPRILSLASSDTQQLYGSTETMRRWTSLNIETVNKGDSHLVALWMGQVLKRDIGKDYYPFPEFYKRIFGKDYNPTYTAQGKERQSLDRALDFFDDLIRIPDIHPLIGILLRIGDDDIQNLVMNPELKNFRDVRLLMKSWGSKYSNEGMCTQNPETRG